MSTITDTLELGIDELRPHPQNARVHDLDVIKESLEVHGQYRAIVARRSNRGKHTILAGHGTWEAARELGRDRITVHLIDCSAEQAKRIVAVDNRSNDLAGYAPDRLLDLLGDLPSLEGTGYSASALEELAREVAPKERPPDTAPDPPANPKTKPGDLYQLGEHRLLCGDSTVATDVERLMAGDSAALMATDPPYGVGVDHTWRDGKVQSIGAARSGTVANDDRADWREAWVLTDAPVAYVWHSALHASLVAESLAASKFEIRQQIIWVKEVMALGRSAYHWKHEPCWYAVRRGANAAWRGGRDQTTVWEAPSLHPFSKPEDGDTRTEHPTQKPLSIFVRPIVNHTTAGEVVYDPFGGSGTALMACEAEGRSARLMELDPGYCDVIIKRWQDYTGQKAVLDG